MANGIDEILGQNPALADIFMPQPTQSGIGSILTFLQGATPVVGGAVSLINMVSNFFAQSDYKRQMERNRKLAERIYRQQRQDEEETKEEEQRRFELGRQDIKYARTFTEEERGYQRKRDVEADKWKVKQDRFAKYMQFMGNFNSYLSFQPTVRQQHIQNWQAVGR